MSTSSYATSNSPPSVVETDKHIFFYGHELTLPLARLQQWYPSSFLSPTTHPGIRFQTAEHYVMYVKATTFSDASTAEKILFAATPLEAKRLGRQVANFDSKEWNSLVDSVAEEGNWLKFSQVAECKEALLATGEKGIAEASPDDRNWGIGFRGDEAEGREEEWGRNLLGKALERVRERLRREEQAKV